MTPKDISLPAIVSRKEWLSERKKLLKAEKELTRKRDELNTQRRRLPMVEIKKYYTFEGPDGEVSLLDLFDGRRQLIVYHFMFEPDGEEGCPSCSFLVDNIGHLSHLHVRNTTLVLVSRAPLARLVAYKERMNWNIPWYSSYGSDFNYDFHVTLDESRGSDEYNYKPLFKLGERMKGWTGEQPGTSTFIRKENSVFHTYSSYERGLDKFLSTYTWLDLTALGRQEEWEEPAGRSDSKLMRWLRRHDQYEKQI